MGGAIFPVMMGALADRFGVHHSMLLPFLCYIFIVYYGFKGYQIAPDEPKAHLSAAS